MLFPKFTVKRLLFWGGAAAVEGKGGNRDKGRPKGGAAALRDTYQVPLDEKGDILCEEQKPTTQQKQADTDKRRRRGLIMPELREFSGKMPPRYLAEASRPIRPGDAPL